MNLRGMYTRLAKAADPQAQATLQQNHAALVAQLSQQSRYLGNLGATPMASTIPLRIRIEIEKVTNGYVIRVGDFNYDMSGPSTVECYVCNDTDDLIEIISLALVKAKLTKGSTPT